MFEQVKNLPNMIQDALASIGYKKTDVKINVSESVSIQCSGYQGTRAFALILNLNTGDKKMFYGSWGGANAFNTNNHVDLDNTDYIIPINGVVIKGYEGVGPVHAIVYTSPANTALQVTNKTTDLSQDEKQVLNALQSYKAAYRKDYLTGRFAENARLNYRCMSEDQLSDAYQSLSKKGFIKINKAGSISITTEGKNASN